MSIRICFSSPRKGGGVFRKLEKIRLFTSKRFKEFTIDSSVFIKREREVEEIDLSTADTGCLDEFHSRSCLIVSRFEYIYTRSFTISEGEFRIFEFCIFKIVFCRLEVIEFTIALRCHDLIESISKDDEIIRESSFRLGRYICPYY